MRLRIVPPTKPDAEIISECFSLQKKLTATARKTICVLKNHMPALMAPMAFIALGAIHVAESSKTTDRVRVNPTVNEV